MNSTTPIPSARSSLFLFRKFYLEHMSTAQLTNDFWHHQLASSVGNKKNSNHITTSQTKSCIILTHSMATNNNHKDEPMRDRKTWVLSKKRFWYFLGHLSFWVSGVELPLIFYTKNKEKLIIKNKWLNCTILIHWIKKYMFKKLKITWL